MSKKIIPYPAPPHNPTPHNPTLLQGGLIVHMLSGTAMKSDPALDWWAWAFLGLLPMVLATVLVSGFAARRAEKAARANDNETDKLKKWVRSPLTLFLVFQYPMMSVVNQTEISEIFPPRGISPCQPLPPRAALVPPRAGCVGCPSWYPSSSPCRLMFLVRFCAPRRFLGQGAG